MTHGVQAVQHELDREASINTVRVDMQFDASTGHVRQPLRDSVACRSRPNPQSKAAPTAMAQAMQARPSAR